MKREELLVLPSIPAVISDERMATQAALYASAAGLGLATHAFYFNKGEHHLYGVKYLQSFLGLCTTAIILLIRSGGLLPREAFAHVSAYAGCFLAGLLASLLIYRTLLSPLTIFPGPLPARLSNFWFTHQCTGGHGHRKLLQWHQRYGQFVRTGSNDLSITHPEAVNAIYGTGSKCIKAPFYDDGSRLTSMHSTRNRTHHDMRRRVWSPAFSDKALRNHEERIRSYNEQLKERLLAFAGKPVDVSMWFNYYSFDIGKSSF